MMDKRNLSKSPCQKSKIDKETVIKVTDIQSINLVPGGNDNEFGGGGGIPRLAPSLAVSAGHGVDDACLNMFLTATLQRDVRKTVLVRASASACVVPPAGIHVVDTGVSGILPPVLLVVSVNFLRPAMNVSMLARLSSTVYKPPENLLERQRV